MQMGGLGLGFHQCLGLPTGCFEPELGASGAIARRLGRLDSVRRARLGGDCCLLVPCLAAGYARARGRTGGGVRSIARGRGTTEGGGSKGRLAGAWRRWEERRRQPSNVDTSVGFGKEKE